jgi:membrane associated rhomboid family serine protease
MTEPTEGDGAAVTPDETARLRDGSLDFSSYSLAQLNDLKQVIDGKSQPANYANLLAEIARRETPDLESSSTRGRFSARDGWRGWIEAKRRHSPVYGSGSLELGAASLALHGMQRTWLGAAEQCVVDLPLATVRNVACDDEWIRFESKRRFLPTRNIRFKAPTPGDAAHLASQLPREQTRGFERRWNEVRAFHARVRQLGGNAWSVTALVLINIAVFITMAAMYGVSEQFDALQLIEWGANFGPATIDGQWWRLITAQFVHGDVLHLLANMWVLFNAGRLARQVYGSAAFLGIYFGTGLCGFLASLAWNPANVSVGASGAIFGVLAAFMAFLLHQRAQLPASMLRAHWKSTLIFIVFNLVSGALQANIDNAAHVGGMVSGLALGWLLARPMDPVLRVRFPAWQAAASLAFVGAVAVAAFFQVQGLGAQMTSVERFARDHAWYVSGEKENLRLWQTLASGLGSGTISEADVSRRFESEIIPFWKDANARLSATHDSTAGKSDEYAALAVEFSKVRLEWAQAIADITRHRDRRRAEDVARLMGETERIQAQIERLQMRAHMEHRPRALAHSLFVNRLRRLLNPQAWECVESPPRAGRKLAKTDSAEDAPAMSHDIGCQAQRRFHEGDFQALDAMMRAALGQLNDLPDGGSSLAAQFSALSTMLYYGGFSLEDMLGKTADWRRAVADPLMAELVEAMIFQQWAWTARGGGSSDEVTGQGWYYFKHRSEMAAAALRSIEESGDSMPVWHDLSLDVALDLSEEKDRIRAIFDRGVERFPSYLPLHSGMLRTLMPRWHGSYEEVDRFIVEVSTRSDNDQDLAMYARLYWNYFVLEQDDCNIFIDANASWTNLDLGFAELVKLHPRSDYLLNAYAVMACQIRDRERYAELRKEVGRRLSNSAWSDKYSLDGCDRQMRWQP